jgi:hypothetical protein
VGWGEAQLGLFFLLSCITLVVLNGEFQVLAKSVPEGARFRNTLSACGGDRKFEDFSSLQKSITIIIEQ